MITNQQSGTCIDEITNGIYRISTPVPPEVVPGGFTFNQEAIASVIPVNSLRFVSFSHFEADECGSLNDFLELAPEAEPLCSRIAKMVSIDDFAERPARALADGEELTLGEHLVQWYDTPHFPHAWECGHLLEKTTSTLFCGDLFTQGGHDHQPLTTEDILEPSEQMRAGLDYFSQTRLVQELAEKLAATSPQVLACMHGAAWQGDGASLLRQLGKRLAG
jgi:flavorubredoxin